MSTGLNAVYEELRRLQLEGVDHIFIEEATLDMIRPTGSTGPVQGSRPQRSPAASDLKAIVAGEGQASDPGFVPPKPTRMPPTTGKPIPAEGPPPLEIPGGDAPTQLEWLRKQVEACPTCREQVENNGKLVFGEGAPDADILFCGEAPVGEDAAEGRPFTGEAGQLFSKILLAMGLSRDSVYLTNILKWRPAHDKPYGNRPPTLEEMRFCLPFLKAQIDIVKPKVIVALGNTTVNGLLGPDPSRRMATLRGTWQRFHNIDMMITFQPSYLLRNDTLKTKRMAWEDLLQVMDKVGLPITEKQRGFFLPK